ncbi:MAG: hypothetical protein ACRDH5_05370, partial [bacterium]
MSESKKWVSTLLIALSLVAPLSLGFSTSTNNTGAYAVDVPLVPGDIVVAPQFGVEDFLDTELPVPNATAPDPDAPVPPIMPPSGLGQNDPWLDARGDKLFGNLDVGGNALV